VQAFAAAPHGPDRAPLSWLLADLADAEMLMQGKGSREFVELSQMTGDAKWLGEALLAATGWLFEGWHAYRNGEIDRAGFTAWMGRVQAQLAELLGLAKGSGHWRAGPLGRELLRQWECLWRFVRVPGVEPTNNAGGASGAGCCGGSAALATKAREAGRSCFATLQPCNPLARDQLAQEMGEPPLELGHRPAGGSVHRILSPAEHCLKAADDALALEGAKEPAQPLDRLECVEQPPGVAVVAPLIEEEVAESPGSAARR
jgi:hypothetical protein